VGGGGGGGGARAGGGGGGVGEARGGGGGGVGLEYGWPSDGGALGGTIGVVAAAVGTRKRLVFWPPGRRLGVPPRLVLATAWAAGHGRVGRLWGMP